MRCERSLTRTATSSTWSGSSPPLSTKLLLPPRAGRTSPSAASSAAVTRRHVLTAGTVPDLDFGWFPCPRPVIAVWCSSSSAHHDPGPGAVSHRLRIASAARLAGWKDATAISSTRYTCIARQFAYCTRRNIPRCTSQIPLTVQHDSYSTCRFPRPSSTSRRRHVRSGALPVADRLGPTGCPSNYHRAPIHRRAPLSCAPAGRIDQRDIHHNCVAPLPRQPRSGGTSHADRGSCGDYHWPSWQEPATATGDRSAAPVRVDCGDAATSVDPTACSCRGKRPGHLRGIAAHGVRLARKPPAEIQPFRPMTNRRPAT